MHLVQDVLQARGGAESVLLTLSAAARRVTIGLAGGEVARAASVGRGKEWQFLHVTDDLSHDPYHVLADPGWLLAASRRLEGNSPDLLLHHHFSLALASKCQGVTAAYLHTPTRLLWEPDRVPWETDKATQGFIDTLLALELEGLRRVRVLLVNSAATAQRVQTHYGRPAFVVYPPLDIPRDPDKPPLYPGLPSHYALTMTRFAPERNSIPSCLWRHDSRTPG